MGVKVNDISHVTQVPDTARTVAGDGSFKFTLASAITDAELQAKVDALMEDITAQGNRIAQHMDISRQGVRDFIKRGEKQLFDFENCVLTEIKLS